MALTFPKRIAIAKEFVRIGFGEAIDDDAAFYSHSFLTQELTTTEAREVIPVLKHYNEFDGEAVANAIGRFQGRVSGWKFGAELSPLLVVVLAPWSHQIEDTKPGSGSGRKFSEAEMASLVEDLRSMFINELKADSFEQQAGSEFSYRAWWG